MPSGHQRAEPLVVDAGSETEHEFRGLGLCCLQGDAEPLGQIYIGYDFICYPFEVSPGSIVAAVWAKDAEYAEYAEQIPVTLAAPALLQAVDSFGFRLKTTQNTDKRLTFTFGRGLIYLTFPGTDAGLGQRSLQGGFDGVWSCPDRRAEGER